MKLPSQWENLPFLGEFYGTIPWSVKSIYCGYVGWFDGNAASLMPVRDRDYTDVVLSLIGNHEKVVAKIKTCIKQEEYQMALQLCEFLLQDSAPASVLDLKKQALPGRAKQMTSANARHYYNAAAKAMELSL